MVLIWGKGHDVIKKEQSLYVEYFFDGYIYALKMLQNPSQLVFSYLSDEELIIESQKYYHFLTVTAGNVMHNVAVLKDDVVNLKQRSTTRDPLINKSLLIIGAKYGLDLRALHEFISSPLAYLLPHFAEKDLFDWFSKQAFLNDSGQGLIKTMVNAIDHVCEELEQAHEQEQEEEYSSVTTCTLL